MEQFDQLLTCAICLDRYRNPKLLPCQHSFCMEPCMDGLVDYVRRQVKCPECRAEHRIPYNGVQGFPNNVTLQRFLELHIEISGELPDPTANLVMERCGVCSEKSYCSLCCHCDKKVCAECKEGHLDILRREIMRINCQIRRMLHRLQDSIRDIERSECQINQNKASVLEEVEQVHIRLQKALKDRTEFLKSEMANYAVSELKNHKLLRENLEQELVNMESNCELVEKYMQDDKVEWDDCELMDTKDVFLKTMEFIRNFDYEGGDYSRRAKLNMNHDTKTLVNNVSTYADINFNIPNQMRNLSLTSSTLTTPSITRSKSDHRLASQFRDYELSHGESDLSALGQRRPFGERSGFKDRYGSDKSYGGDDDFMESRPRRFRSRFTRNLDPYDAEDYPSSRRVSCVDAPTIQTPQIRERVIDTEDVTRGPLSGVTRLSDSPRVMQRLQDSTKEKKVKPEPPPPVVQSKPQVVTQPKRTSRQVSEEDEISKIKKQNKSQESSEIRGKVDEVKQDSVPPSRRTSVEKREDSSTSARTSTEREDSSSSAGRRRRNAAVSRVDSIPESSITRDTHSKVYQRQISNVEDKPLETTRKYSRTSSSSSLALDDPDSTVARVARRLSCESTSSESSSRSSPIRNTGAAFSTDEIRAKFNKGSGSEKETSTPRSRLSSQSSVRSNDASSDSRTRPRFQSRFLGRAGTPTAEVSKESESESETDETSESDTESEEERTVVKKDASRPSMAKSDIGPLLAKSAQARENKVPEKTASQRLREEEKASPFSRSRTTSSLYSSSRDRKDPLESPSYSPRNSTYSTKDYSNSYSSPRDSYASPTDHSSYRSTRDNTGYGSYGGYGRDRDTASSYTPSTYGRDNSSASTNRDLGSTYARRPSYLGVSGTGDDPRDDSDRYGHSRYRSRSRGNIADEGGYQSRFLNKSKSSAALGPELEPMKISDDSYYPSGRSRYAALRDRRSRIARSKSSADLGNNEENNKSDEASSQYYNYTDTSPEGQAGNLANKDLSSWARYLKNKYGSRKKDEAGRRASFGFLGTDSPDSTDTESKLLPNQYPNSPSSPIANLSFNTPRAQYLQKGSVLFRFGNRGSDQGRFTWPRGIAVGPDNSIVVADSSNHRVQVFNPEGVFVKEFGSYGNSEGEFDCLAGIAVNRIGQFIIADRYNHRIQVFDPSGRFLRCFGNQGSADGRFSYPWGVTTDALGFIYVCDKENHRVQVFQSDGTFVGKFGTLGNGPGELEHPHYIAVSSTNRVIVSDSNNHRIQIFDVNGQVISSFGSEGSEEGQFKFPRGIAVDDNGYIFVSDSGNNRIQIFHPDGAFLKSFGCWGSGDGEFKGLEGIAVMSNGNILVCDRENHRVQVF